MDEVINIDKNVDKIKDLENKLENSINDFNNACEIMANSLKEIHERVGRLEEWLSKKMIKKIQRSGLAKPSGIIKESSIVI